VLGAESSDLCPAERSGVLAGIVTSYFGLRSAFILGQPGVARMLGRWGRMGGVERMLSGLAERMFVDG
jgi:hypothetical protein